MSTKRGQGQPAPTAINGDYVVVHEGVVVNGVDLVVDNAPPNTPTPTPAPTPDPTVKVAFSGTMQIGGATFPLGPGTATVDTAFNHGAMPMPNTTGTFLLWGILPLKVVFGFTGGDLHVATTTYLRPSLGTSYRVTIRSASLIGFALPVPAGCVMDYLLLLDVQKDTASWANAQYSGNSGLDNPTDCGWMNPLVHMLFGLTAVTKLSLTPTSR